MNETHHQQPSDPLFGEANEPTVKIENAGQRSDEAVGQSFGRYKLLEKLSKATWIGS